MNIPFVDIQSPFTWVVIGVIAIALIIKQRKMFGTDADDKRDEDQTRVFVHDDQGYAEKLGDTFSGNVSYGTGAFIKSVTCAMKFYYGRPKRSAKLLSSRKATTIYHTRFGDASPLHPDRKDWAPDTVSKATFNSYRAIAVEREYSRGRMSAQQTNPQYKLMMSLSIGAAILGGLGWLLVLILPLTPLVEKSVTP